MNNTWKQIVFFVCVWFAFFVGMRVGVGDKHILMVKWTEACWPNKPVWTEDPGHCWINGQKVLVDMEGGPK